MKDPAPIIADLLSTALIGGGSKFAGPLVDWQNTRQLYCWERDALQYLADRKAAGDRPPIGAWTAWIVDEGYPPEKAGPELHGKYWRPNSANP